MDNDKKRIRQKFYGIKQGVSLGRKYSATPRNKKMGMIEKIRKKTIKHKHCFSYKDNRLRKIYRCPGCQQY